MQEWISNNWLALYGSIVGTLALLINVTRFIHAVKKDKIKLLVSVVRHPDYDSNIYRLKEKEYDPAWERPNLVEVYTITIRNTGTVDAYIENASVICDKNKVYPALSRYSNSGSTNGMLGSISQVGTIKIEPKASKKLDVFLKAEEDVFTAKYIEIEDSTGKKWRKSA